MKKLLYIISVCLVAVACERRALTYNYNPTVEVIINSDWSNMSKAPTGMSVYCYPEDGGKPIIKQTNNTSTTSVDLPAGVFNILVFNQIPAEFGSVTFSGMNSFESAQISGVTTRSTWATSKAPGDIIRNPEEVAAATYLDFEVTEEDIRKAIELQSYTKTETEIEPFATIPLTPRVVTKTTRVRIRLSGIYNHRSTRATLYGMASGYHFFEQQSYADEVTHVLESWSLKSYDGYREGEVYTHFTCFGLPELHTSTRADNPYADWDGEMKLDILLADNKTVVSQTIPLADKVVIASETDPDTSKGEDGDSDLDMDVNVDIHIDSGFGDTDSSDDDTPIVLPDVEQVGGSESGFDAVIDDWGDEEQHDVEI